MVGSIQLIQSNNEPLKGAEVTAFQQSRITDDAGIVQLEHVPQGQAEISVRYKGQIQFVPITVTSSSTQVTLKDNWQPLPDRISERVVDNNTQAVNMLTSLLITLVAFGAVVSLLKNRNGFVVHNKRGKSKKGRHAVLLGLLVLGFVSGAASVKQLVALNNSGYLLSDVSASEITNLPKPLNVKAFGDDRVATIQWDAPSDAEAQKIVGYIVRWGKAGGALSSSKQTIHTVTQIQPLDPDADYVVTVQSVQGTYENRKYPEGYSSGTRDSQIAVANGNISAAVQTTVKTSSARVTAMRGRLTGFFDDFNMPAGNFDERKWNTAYTACTSVSEDGAFINSQLHAHNQIKSDCDRGGTVSRPRALFNVEGATEENPALIEFDFDGVTQPRDAWYIDLIPANARSVSGTAVPLDLTSHNDLWGGDSNDPGNMLRLHQAFDNIHFTYWSNARQSTTLTPSYSCAISWNKTATDWLYCSTATQSTKYDPLPRSNASLNPIPNFRRHWVMEYSPTKIKIFIDGVRIVELPTPPDLAAVKEFQVHNTLFSYNTGKDYDTVEITTSMLHWDNFGFSGPVPKTVTHSYLEGGATGGVPYIGRGTTQQPVPAGKRKTIIKIPDEIKSPVQARLHFTLQNFGWSAYSWSSTDHILVNGTQVALVNPQTQMANNYTGPIAETYIPFATAIIIPNAATVLKQGDNTIELNITGTDMLNVHLELDYTKGTEPSFTQPQNIFTGVTFNDFIMPKMRFQDTYWFVEQVMGLDLAQTTPAPTAPPQSTPVPTLRPTSIVTPTRANSPSPIPTNTPRPPTVTPLPTATVQPTRIPSPTSAVTPTLTPTPTRTPTPSITPRVSPTAAPVQSASSKIVIYAGGSQSGGTYPTMQLSINGQIVKTWTNVGLGKSTGNVSQFSYTHTQKINARQIQVRFTNDDCGWDSTRCTKDDRNLRVQKIVVDGVSSPTISSTVYSVGGRNSVGSCANGNLKTEWLNCTGYFQF